MNTTEKIIALSNLSGKPVPAISAMVKGFIIQFNGLLDENGAIVMAANTLNVTLSEDDPNGLKTPAETKVSSVNDLWLEPKSATRRFIKFETNKTTKREEAVVVIPCKDMNEVTADTQYLDGKFGNFPYLKVLDQDGNPGWLKVSAKSMREAITNLMNDKKRVLKEPVTIVRYGSGFETKYEIV